MAEKHFTGLVGITVRKSENRFARLKECRCVCCEAIFNISELGKNFIILLWI